MCLKLSHKDVKTHPLFFCSFRSHRKYWEDVIAGRVAKKTTVTTATIPAEEHAAAPTTQDFSASTEEASPAPATARPATAAPSKQKVRTAKGGAKRGNKRVARLCQTARKNTTSRPTSAIPGRMTNKDLVGITRTMNLYR